jgi:hypothetical protein
MYGYVKEAIPPNAPVARGKAIDLIILWILTMQENISRVA